MKLETIELSAVIPGSPADVFKAWMTSKGHAAFTGAPATVERRAGTRHTAWDGYIHGWVLAVGAGRNATFAWRTTDFAPTDIDSVVDLSMARTKGGTRVKITHTEIPEGQGARYAKGWEEFYFTPLTKHFAERAETKKTVLAKKKPAAKKKVAAKKKPAAKKGR